MEVTSELRIDDLQQSTEQCLPPANTIAHFIYSSFLPGTSFSEHGLDGINHWAVMRYQGTPANEIGQSTTLWLEIYDYFIDNEHPQCHFVLDLKLDLIYDRWTGKWLTLSYDWVREIDQLKLCGIKMLRHQHYQFRTLVKKRFNRSVLDPIDHRFGIKYGIREWGKHLKGIPADLAYNPIRPGTPRPSQEKHDRRHTLRM